MGSEQNVSYVMPGGHHLSLPADETPPEGARVVTERQVASMRAGARAERQRAIDAATREVSARRAALAEKLGLTEDEVALLG